MVVSSTRGFSSGTVNSSPEENGYIEIPPHIKVIFTPLTYKFNSLSLLLWISAGSVKTAFG